jgi:hypothetical protein
MIITDQDEYRASKAVSYSWLKRFLADPDLFYRRFILGQKPDEEPEESKALAMGTAAHCFVLEGPAAFAERYVIHPATYASEEKKTKRLIQKKWNANASVCRLWTEAQEEMGRSIVSPKDAALLSAMRQGVEGNATAAGLLNGAQTELAIRRSYRDLPFERQGRLDLINHARGAIADVKTIGSLNDRAVEMERRKYYCQLAYYQDLAEEEFAGTFELFIVWLEKEWPYRCTVEKLSQGYIDLGRRENARNLLALAECYTSDTWARIPECVEIRPSAFLTLQAEAAE